MARPVIVAGASGAGKSFLLEQLGILDPRVVPIKKLTTRTPRPYEATEGKEHFDLDFSHPLRDVQTCDYRYFYGSDWYGIRRTDIELALSRGLFPVTIVRNADAILTIKRDFPSALVLYLQSALSGDDLRRRLAQQGRDDLDINERMRRLEDDFHDYVGHLELFDYVLINYYDRQSLLEQMQKVLRVALSDTRIDQRLVFVLMSFNPRLYDLFKAIRNAGQMVPQLQLNIQRSGTGLGDYKITEAILQSIQRASLIICDLSEDRPNVYYELGYARGLSKTVVTCAQDGVSLPFDIKDFRTVFYNSPLDLQERMVDEFRHHFERQL